MQTLFNPPQYEYDIKFVLTYSKGLRSHRHVRANGTIKLKTKHTLEELTTAEPYSEIGKGVVKLIHTDVKTKVPGRVTSIIIKTITPTVT